MCRTINKLSLILELCADQFEASTYGYFTVVRALEGVEVNFNLEPEVSSLSSGIQVSYL